MLKELLNQGLVVLIKLVVLFIMLEGIKFLRKKIGNEKLQEYYNKAKKAVQAAEMLYGAGAGEEKKAWVLEYLAKAFGNKISDDDINMLIESAVQEMNYVLKNQGLENGTKTIPSTDTSQTPTI